MINYDVVDLNVNPDTDLTDAIVLQMRGVTIDCLEKERGDHLITGLPLGLKDQDAVRGNEDLDALQLRLEVDAPTLPPEALMIMMHISVQRSGV